MCAVQVSVCSAHYRTDGGTGPDKSNTSFESVKTLRLFVCTHNNKTLCFCKTMKADRMRFLPSRSLWTWARNSVYTCLTDMKKIYLYRVKCLLSNKLIQMKTNILRLGMKHAYRCITTAEMTRQCRQVHLLSRKQKALFINELLKC